jgi:hypothetical protein
MIFMGVLDQLYQPNQPPVFIGIFHQIWGEFVNSAAPASVVDT